MILLAGARQIEADQAGSIANKVNQRRSRAKRTGDNITAGRSSVDAAQTLSRRSGIEQFRPLASILRVILKQKLRLCRYKVQLIRIRGHHIRCFSASKMLKRNERGSKIFLPPHVF